MSKKRRSAYVGCSVDAPAGVLRLRYRWEKKQRVFRLRLSDTRENREAAQKLAQLVAACVRSGRDPRSILDECRQGASLGPKLPSAPAALTVADYFERWIVTKTPPEVRRAQAIDYRRHMVRHVLPTFGDLPIDSVTARDILGLRAEMRQRKLSLKYAKNILAGSFKAMMRDARVIDHVVTHDAFEGVTWPRVEMPGPDPFDVDERRRILGWFRDKRYGFHPGPNTNGPRFRPHPHYHAYVHLLLWTGMRPSEVAALRWSVVDLDRALLEVRRSRHLYEDSATKTARARRTVELLPETVRVLRELRPVRVDPETFVLLNTNARPLEPRAFAPHWNACLRALGIRPRGIYSCKDTYISTVLPLKPIPWIEEQTGVCYATLKRHYGRWIPRPGSDEASMMLERLARGTELCPGDTIAKDRHAQKDRVGPRSFAVSDECRGGESNP